MAFITLKLSPDEFGLSEFESLMYQGFSLALNTRSGVSSVEYSLDSLVLKEFCKECEIDFLWFYSVCKRLINELLKDV